MTECLIYQRVGNRIVFERKRKRFSQEALAAAIRMDRTYLARIEEGKANPTLKVLYKISRKLNMRISELLIDI